MKRIILYFIIILFFLNNCKEINNLINTSWVFESKFSSGNISDTIRFYTNNNCTYYQCELEYNFKGNYKVKKDTIFLNLIDDQVCEDGGKITNYNFLLFIENKKIFQLLPDSFKPNKVYLRKL